MRLLTIIVLMAFTLTAVAQKSPLEKVINKYGEKDGISTQVFEPGSEEFQDQFKMQGEAVNKALDKIEVLKVINVDTKETSLTTYNKFYGKVLSALEDERYAELMKINSDNGEYVSIHMNQDENGSVNELVAIIIQEEEFIMVYVKGVMDMSNLNIGELISSFVKNKKDKDCEHSDPGGH
jgi:hypothetical protein